MIFIGLDIKKTTLFWPINKNDPDPTWKNQGVSGEELPLMGRILQNNQIETDYYVNMVNEADVAEKYLSNIESSYGEAAQKDEK